MFLNNGRKIQIHGNYLIEKVLCVSGGRDLGMHIRLEEFQRIPGRRKRKTIKEPG